MTHRVEDECPESFTPLSGRVHHCNILIVEEVEILLVARPIKIIEICLLVQEVFEKI